MKMRTIIFGLLITLSFIGCKKSDDIVPPPPPPPPPPAPKLPVIITNPISDLTAFSVILSGKVADTSASNVTEQGFVVDTVPGPTITKNLNKIKAQRNSNGDFSAYVINIPANANWYIRAYGTNAQGTGYGEEVTFRSFPEKVFFGIVTLESQQQVNAFGANNYTRVRGSIYIKGNDITDLSPLSSLVVIENGFEVKNTRLVNFHGLEKLEAIGNTFAHDFRVENNQLLKNYSGLKSLKFVNGTFYVLNNDALENLVGLESFTTSAYGEFRIDGCDKITSINGLEKMQMIFSSIMLKDNPLLTDLRAWGNLTMVSESIRIINNASLQRLDGFEKIKKLESFEIIGNQALNDISGIRNIDTITRSIHINDNDALSDLSAFNNITTTQAISISNNAILPDLGGFRDLQALQESIYIGNNASLTSMHGLKRLKSLSRIEIYSNPSLLNLNGLDSLTTLTGSYSLSIYANPQLKSLDGLQKLTTAYGSVQIFQNPALTNFCGLKPLFTSGYNQHFWTELNGVNPTQSQVVSTCP